MSGGLDSAAIAALHRPDACLFVDYGQLPASGEAAAAHQVAQHLDLVLLKRDANLSALGSGLLVGTDQTSEAPTPEWFPFRNQFLVTVAAAVAVVEAFDEVWIGLTEEDRDRHADGTPRFVEVLSDLLGLQEGAIVLRAPGIGTSSAELVARAALDEPVIASTISCHVATLPCGQCPGCAKRRAVLTGKRGET